MTDLLALPKLTLTPKKQETNHVVKLDRNLARVVHERVQGQHPGLQVSKRWAMEFALLQWLGIEALEGVSESCSPQPWQVVIDEHS